MTPPAMAPACEAEAGLPSEDTGAELEEGEEELEPLLEPVPVEDGEPEVEDGLLELVAAVGEAFVSIWRCTKE
jgi:hypothetical protein